MRLASRIDKIPPSGIREFFDLLTKSEDIISLGVGEPDFDAPNVVKEKAIESLKKGETSYTSNWGIEELREKLSEKLEKENHVKYDAGNEILVTSGSSEALNLAVMALVGPGDSVLIPEPAYVSYVPNVLLAGAEPVPVTTYEENGFRVSVEDLEKKVSENTRLLLYCSPSNPTGTVLTKKDLEEIADFSREHDIFVISDEIYEKLVYDGAKHYSIASLDGMRERTVTINGFSKAFAMTGFRLGYAASPVEVSEAMMKIHQYTMMCAPTTAQYAALSALEKTEKEVEEMRREYDRRRRLIVKGLNEIDGISCFNPQGAFYAFPNISSFGLSSKDFSVFLLKEAKVATVGGNVFGESGEGHIRCSYATEYSKIEEALDRIGSACKTLSKNAEN